MVNKNDAIGLEEWRELPYEKQMGFRIPISVMIDLPRLRKRHPVITASEYLRLHGQGPESESSSGYWYRDIYIGHPNVFETNKTKTPTQFIIENHWYDPHGINRVDHIPESMKNRGKWEHHFGPEIGETAGRWPDEGPTEISTRLKGALPEGKSVLSWETAKSCLAAFQIGSEVDLDNDQVVESVLKANGWEVLHSFLGQWASLFPLRVLMLIFSLYFRQEVEVILPRPSFNLSKKSRIVPQYEASRKTIIV